MAKQILFIHSAGKQGEHDGSGDFLAFLRPALSANYDFRSPLMPAPQAPRYETWKEKLGEEIAKLDDGAILIGHSLGGSVILQYLSEEKPEKTFGGLFVVASPFWGADSDWQVNEYKLHDYFASKLPSELKIFLYRSRDDDVIPHAHLEKYAQALPQAAVREVDGQGHTMSGETPEIVEDIKSL